MSAMMRFLDWDDDNPPFAPPFLRAGKLLIAQTTNILMFLGPRHGLVPKMEAGRLWVNQLQLTIADFVAEIHDVHHPISGSLYYEEQKREARRRAGDFRNSRAPKYLSYFESVLVNNPAGDKYLVGRSLSYADLSLFQIVEGLHYAFPKMMKRLERRIPKVCSLHCRVADRPRIQSYLASDRRVEFNKEGIFRYYKELDG
jgi:glutathione S-transferase